jgi:rare lipoprotein A (peptidoglycan hydrolase)
MAVRSSRYSSHGKHRREWVATTVRHSAMPGIPHDAGRTMGATDYGYGLGGSPTASGHPFDPEGYTAAHRRLPLGTRLRVSLRRRIGAGHRQRQGS